MMFNNPTSRFHRIIRKLSRLDDTCLSGLDSEGAALSAGDQILGVYRGDNVGDDIVFTNNGCIFMDRISGAIRKISYDEVKVVEYPLPASDSVDLILHLVDASIVKMHVTGQKNNYRDVFEVGRFFMRVAEDAGRG